MANLPVPNRSTLQQRVADRLALWKLIEETGGEVCPTLESWLAEIDKSLATKADQYVFIKHELEQEASRLRDEGRKLIEAAKQIEYVQDRLNNRIKIAMVQLNVDEIKGEFYRFKMNEMAQKLVLNEADVPQDLKIPVTEYVPDKEKIKALLALGENVPGASMERVYGLRTYVSKGDKS